MDLTIQTETQAVPDLTWIRSKGQSALSGTLYTTDLVEATHFPDGYVKSGTVLGFFTAGGGSGLWTPWVEDGANGEEDIGGILFTGGQVRKNAAGVVISTRTICSVVYPNRGWVINPANLPAGLLTDGTTANTATGAQLEAAGFVVEK